MCAASGSTHLEWRADVHVSPGDTKRAREVGQMTRDAGLTALCFGFYYRCDEGDFSPVLECALEPGTPTIRVWAGSGESGDGFSRVRDDLERISALSRAQNIKIALEFHSGTLAHSGQNARRSLDAGSGAFSSLWQPLRRLESDENLEELRCVSPSLKHVHVYQWRGIERVSLENSKQWPRYIEELRALNLKISLLLEFVPGDDVRVLEGEAAALRLMCKNS